MLLLLACSLHQSRYIGTVPYGNTFLTLGGWYDYSRYKDIHQLGFSSASGKGRKEGRPGQDFMDDGRRMELAVQNTKLVRMTCSWPWRLFICRETQPRDERGKTVNFNDFHKALV